MAILTPIYEAEFLGFSYGFRPKRNQHPCISPSGGDLTTSSDHHSDFEARQLVLFGVAIIVLLVFAWTFVR